MVDIGTGLAAGLGAKEIVSKVFGPSAELLGDKLKGLLLKADVDINLKKILDAFRRRLGARADQPGAVPLRVLKGLLNEGEFCTDPLTAEYFGGVLASSRTEVSRDDRGAALMSLVGRLSTYEIRSHFLFYLAIKSVLGAPLPSEQSGERRVFVPMNSYLQSMDFTGSEDSRALTGHAVLGLHREDLLDNPPMFGDENRLARQYEGVEGDGIIIGDSFLGSELFLWAHGQGDVSPFDFLNPAVILQYPTGIAVLEGCTVVEKKTELTRGTPLQLHNMEAVKRAAEEAASDTARRELNEVGQWLRRLR